MITIKNLKWSNWFSYGEDNEINFSEPLIQITGYNGTGKTSIPLILQELFYNKNIKGKKKSSLVNRYVKNPVLWAYSDFNDDNGNLYSIELTRKSTAKLKLIKNGIDISSHTATSTYQTLANIIGLDFSTFAQLTYQSSVNSLEFLISTDTNRKKFLINLFNLNKYLEIFEQFKKASAEVTTELNTVKGKIQTLENWIDKHSKIDFTKKEIKEIPVLDDALISKLGNLEYNLKNIAEKNKKINANNQYKELLNNLDTTILFDNIPTIKENKKELEKNKKESNIEISILKTLIKTKDSEKIKLEKLGDICHSCNQKISEKLKKSMIDTINSDISELLINIKKYELMVKEINEKLDDIRKIEDRIAKKDFVENEVVKLNNLIDNTIPDQVLNQSEIELNIILIKEKIDNIKLLINKISKEIVNIILR